MTLPTLKLTNMTHSNKYQLEFTYINLHTPTSISCVKSFATLTFNITWNFYIRIYARISENTKAIYSSQMPRQHVMLQPHPRPAYRKCNSRNILSYYQITKGAGRRDGVSMVIIVNIWRVVVHPSLQHVRLHSITARYINTYGRTIGALGWLGCAVRKRFAVECGNRNEIHI